VSVLSKLRKARRIVSHKQLPAFVYRMDDRPVAFVKANGLQPKGLRTDGALGQFGPVLPGVSVVEHVKKTSDTTNASINNVDPWISFFAWEALQPISGAVMAFMQGYMQGRIFMIDTATAVAAGYNFHYANEVFDLVERREEGAQYRGQKEWSGYGTTPAKSIRFALPVPLLLAALNVRSAPEPMTLPWVGV
jgi:hypothetical protein